MDAATNNGRDFWEDGTDNDLVVQLHEVRIDEINYALGIPFLISHARRRPELAAAYRFQRATWLMAGASGGVDPEVEEVVASILAEPPRVVGFTLLCRSYDLFLEVIRRVKAEAPEIVTVVGGPTATDMNRDLLEQVPEIDYLFTGPAEHAFADLLEALLAPSGRLDAIHAMHYRDASGEPRASSGEAPALDVLDECGSPLADGLLPGRQTDGDILNVEWTRGCPFECAYCTWTTGQKRLVRFSREYIARDIRWAIEHDFSVIRISDAAINFKTAMLRELAEVIRQADPEQRLSFLAYVQYASLNEEQVPLLRGIRWDRLMAGLQTDDPEGLEALHRPPFRAAQFERAMELMRQAGEVPAVDLIAAVPGDTAEKIRRRVEYLLELGCRVTLFPLLALPGTAIWRNRERYGLQILPEQDYIVCELPTMSHAEYGEVIGYLDGLVADGAPLEMPGFDALGFTALPVRDGSGPDAGFERHDEPLEAPPEPLATWVAQVLRRYRGIPADRKSQLRIDRWEPGSELTVVTRQAARGLRITFHRGGARLFVDAFDRRELPAAPARTGDRLSFHAPPESTSPSTAAKLLRLVLARLDRVRPAAAK